MKQVYIYFFIIKNLLKYLWTEFILFTFVIITMTITSLSYPFPICYKHFNLYTYTHSATLTCLLIYLLTYLLITT